ncbi:P1 family peptidase [Christiangramia sp.]|uniref:DmpA family aminopeptidase n=1 Tax=Christiangramia sp. TaxID=1931228 RepID=UPI00261E1ED8|nr:P1 family peptidase [Christiangramia sp.]
MTIFSVKKLIPQILFLFIISFAIAQQEERARDLGIPFEGEPGKFNAITDVPGVEVGLTTIIEGEGALRTGKGPVRTGVTAILPRGKTYDPVFAGWYSFNGNGEMTGTTWVEESGFLEGPVMITNTHSVGTVRDAVIEWQFQNKFFQPLNGTKDVFWALPVVAETYDGILNDINGFHVKKEHAFQALDSAKTGFIKEGGVGGGTGMIAHGFKGGTGTSSRIIEIDGNKYTVGVLVQANYGSRRDLTIGGVPVGSEIDVPQNKVKLGSEPEGDTGSIIVIVATDAPLMPHQLKRLARRVPVGIAKVGGYGGNGSGDIFLAFSTANEDASNRSENQSINTIPNDWMNPFFKATAHATEEAIINAIIAGETMEGINGNIIYELPHDKLIELLKKYNRYSPK